MFSNQLLWSFTSFFVYTTYQVMIHIRCVTKASCYYYNNNSKTSAMSTYIAMSVSKILT